MRKNKIWINGRFVGINDAKVSVFDRGFLYGDGVFETMRSYAGIVFKLNEHIDRLFKGLATIRIKAPHSRSYFKKAIYDSLKINKIRSGYIRVAMTRGEGRFGIGYKDDFTPNIVIIAKEFGGYPEWMHDRGLSAQTAGFIQNEYSPLAGIKSMNYLNPILARLYAKEDGYDEAILENINGYITEAATSNIFIVRKGAIITPSRDSGILPGVTRGVIIGIAKKLKLKMVERKIPRREPETADEVFLTNSLAEILPVVKINSKKIGTGKPGEITKLLRISYQKAVIKEVILLR
jgi:branched-chain amino acid aminotransferase